MKSCIHRHPTHPDQRPLRRPKLFQTKMSIFSIWGLRGLWCVGCLWMQRFMAVPMIPSAAVSDFDGRRYHRFVPFNFLLSLAAPHFHGVLVLVTGNKFIAGLLSLAIIVHRCRCHRQYIYRHRHRRWLKILNDTGVIYLLPLSLTEWNDSWKNLKSKILCQTPFNLDSIT